MYTSYDELPQLVISSIQLDIRKKEAYIKKLHDPNDLELEERIEEIKMAVKELTDLTNTLNHYYQLFETRQAPTKAPTNNDEILNPLEDEHSE